MITKRTVRPFWQVQTSFSGAIASLSLALAFWIFTHYGSKVLLYSVPLFIAPTALYFFAYKRSGKFSERVIKYVKWVALCLIPLLPLIYISQQFPLHETTLLHIEQWNSIE